MFVITEFVITEFHLISILSKILALYYLSFEFCDLLYFIPSPETGIKPSNLCVVKLSEIQSKIMRKLQLAVCDKE